MKQPLVSIIIPTYNQESYLSECLDSVLNQTYKNIEIILVDDASTDHTPLIIQEYTRSNKLISVINNIKNLGYGGEPAFNIGVRAAHGAYIAKIDADDIMFDTRIKKQVSFLESHTDIFLVGSWLELIDKSGHTISYRQYPIDHDSIYKKFYLRNQIANPSIMFRNQLKGDFFPIKFSRLNDYYGHFTHMYEGKKYANIPEYLTRYRIHDTNTLYLNIKSNWETSYAMKKTFIEKYKFEPSAIDRILVEFTNLVVKLMPNRILQRLYLLSPWK